MEMNVGKTKVMGISRQPYAVQVMIGQKQPENVEYMNCLEGMITNDARDTREIKSRTAMAKAAFNKKKNFHQQTGFKLNEDTNKALYLECSFVWW
jgi:hypothetical protein